MDNKTPKDMHILEEKRELLALTLTYSFFHNKSPRGQFVETIVPLTKELTTSCEFEIYVEWRLTNSSCHYHCIIDVRDKYRWHTSTLPFLKNNGFVCIKKIDNMDKWRKYCSKEIDLARKITKLTMPITTEICKRPKVVKVTMENNPIFEEEPYKLEDDENIIKDYTA